MQQNIPAISGINDASNARVMLYQSGKPVHAPLSNIGIAFELTPQLFGAKGDGVANDDAALVRWAASTLMLRKRIPAGTYNFTSNLEFAGNSTVRGDGMGASILKRTTGGVGTDALLVEEDNVFFSDFTLQGPSVATYVASEIGIAFRGTTGTHLDGGSVRNVEVYDFGSDGIRCHFADNNTVSGNFVHDCGYAGITNLSCVGWIAHANFVSDITPGTSSNAYGIRVTSIIGESQPDRFVVSNNHVWDIIIWEALDTHGGKNGLISDNVAFNCKYGINVSPNDNDLACENIIVDGNVLHAGSVATPGRGIGSGGGLVNQANNIRVSNNTVIGFGVDIVDDAAMMLQYVNNLQVVNNMLVNCIGGGILYKGTVANQFTAGNVVSGVTGASARLAAFKTRNGTHTGMVTGNSFDGGANYATSLEGTVSGLDFDTSNKLTSSSTVNLFPASIAWTGPKLGVLVQSADGAFTLTPGQSLREVRHTATLAANRTITLAAPTNSHKAADFIITREGTGLFQLIVGATGHALGTGEWVRVRHDAAGYYIAERGKITEPVQTIATDAAVTLTPHANSSLVVHTGTLTADRAVTLATTNALAGDRFRITRTGGGAFNLNVGTGPLKALVTNTWADFIYNGTAWYLSAYGAL